MAHILIIEDDLALQEAYSFILSAAQHHATSAYNGEEGLKLVDKEKYDLILLDLHMPVMDGLQFLTEYKERHLPSTKIIVFSNMIEPENTKQALALGAYKCVLKSSMTPSAMLSLIEQVTRS